MKRRRCCDACRRRHRRCITQERDTRCTACIEADIECHFETGIRFKHTRRESAGTPGPQAAVPRTISFVKPLGLSDTAASPDNTASPAGHQDDEGEALAVDERTAAESGHGVSHPGLGRGFDSPRLSRPEYGIASPPTSHGTLSNLRTTPLQSTSSSSPNVISIPYILADSTPSAREPPAQLGPPSAEADAVSPQAQSAHTSLLTKREAFLFKTYIERLAPSSDACDEARHFTLEVPRLALREPMILHGILALASRYDDRCRDLKSDLEGTYYHSRCIGLLIEAFSKPPDTWDSTLLTAVVIARLYEEYDNEADSHFHHLSGTWNLLNHDAVARFVTQGSLAEAASWVHLRQAIYVYLVQRKPVEVSLTNFERSTAFRRNDDTAYANRIVYLLAKTLTLFFPPGGEHQADTSGPGSKCGQNDLAWELLEQELMDWYGKRPLSFQPIYHEAADPHNGRPFPDFWMAALVPGKFQHAARAESCECANSRDTVVGMQHYYASQIIFCLRKSNTADSSLGFRAAQQRRNAERAISSHLGTLMSLALCNEQAINAFYLPCHMLTLSGFHIQHPCERTHTIQYLKKVKEVLQWNTAPLIKMLGEQWAELDGSEGS